MKRVSETHTSMGVLLLAVLTVGAVGCHHTSRHRGPIHKGCCPNHGQCSEGVHNADYQEPRGQSPEGELTEEGFETDAATTQGSVVGSQPRASTRTTSGVTSGSSASSAGVARVQGSPIGKRPVTGQFQRDPRVSPISFNPAEARRNVAENGQILTSHEESWMTGTDAQRYPDEYLFDGGDRGLPVHYGPFSRQGLDTEDTIGESTDRSGKRRTVVSNQVAIYAPRFAAVRAVTTPNGKSSVAHVAYAEDIRRDSGMKTKVGPQRYAHNEGSRGLQTRLRVSGIESRSGARGIGQVARLREHKLDVKGRESLAFMFRGHINAGQEAYLAAGIDAAMNWSKPEGAVIAAMTEGLVEVRGSSNEGEMVGVEDRYTKPGVLRILKIADKKQAQPGDVITFVLRFENTGDLELRDVRIIDNLTPRLEFIDESATCDLPGDVILEDNSEGSHVLIFTLDNALPGQRAAKAKENKQQEVRTGGVITFQCRVR